MGSCPDTDIDPIHSPFEVYSVEVVELFLIMCCIFFLPGCKHEHGKPPWEKRGRDLLQHFFSQIWMSVINLRCFSKTRICLPKQTAEFFLESRILLWFIAAMHL